MDLNKDTTDAIDNGSAQGAWVRVSVLGAATKTLEYQIGITAGQTLEQAGIEAGEGRIIQVNGVPVEATHLLEPNSTVQVTTAIDNG